MYELPTVMISNTNTPPIMTEKNPNFRLEMFSDGVFAIAITVLILEIKVPTLASMNSTSDVWKAIWHLWPSFLALIISFIVILISWKGHHNTLKYLDKTSNQFQFANGFFLFTVVIIPFPTAFMAEYLDTPYAQPAIVFYCFCMLLHNIGWRLLFRYLLKPTSLMRDPSYDNRIKRIGKGNLYGTLIDSGLIIIAWWLPYIALTLSLLLWIFWLYLSLATEEK
jgi:uncharacterized membrane protein